MLAYKQEAHDNKIQTISHNSSPKNGQKLTKLFFQLIQAKLKNPHCAVAAIPVNPYFRYKSAEHDVTLTSFVAEI